MKTEEFKNMMKDTYKLSEELLLKKRAEYSENGDVLSAFKQASQMQNNSYIQALGGMMSKHTVSLYEMISGKDRKSLEQWDEKILDHINYLILLRAAVFEHDSLFASHNAGIVPNRNGNGESSEVPMSTDEGKYNIWDTNLKDVFQPWLGWDPDRLASTEKYSLGIRTESPLKFTPMDEILEGVACILGDLSYMGKQHIYHIEFINKAINYLEKMIGEGSLGDYELKYGLSCYWFRLIPNAGSSYTTDTPIITYVDDPGNTDYAYAYSDTMATLYMHDLVATPNVAGAYLESLYMELFRGDVCVISDLSLRCLYADAKYFSDLDPTGEFVGDVRLVKQISSYHFQNGDVRSRTTHDSVNDDPLANIYPHTWGIKRYEKLVRSCMADGGANDDARVLRLSGMLMDLYMSFFKKIGEPLHPKEVLQMFYRMVNILPETHTSARVVKKKHGRVYFVFEYGEVPLVRCDDSIRLLSEIAT